MDLTPHPAAFAETVSQWQTAFVDAWHNEDGTPQDSLSDAVAQVADFKELVREQHRRNCMLWHEEDKARDPNADDSIIAEVKRRIDKFNQQRNDRIEQLDEALLKMLLDGGTQPDATLPWNSETPGSIIDRLSILSLKVKHTGVQAERRDADEAHKQKAATRLATLKLQRNDLTTALGRLLEDLQAGRKQMKLYKQFKMYNDPAWNPYGYRSDR